MLNLISYLIFNPNYIFLYFKLVNIPKAGSRLYRHSCQFQNISATFLHKYVANYIKKYIKNFHTHSYIIIFHKRDRPTIWDIFKKVKDPLYDKILPYHQVISNKVLCLPASMATFTSTRLKSMILAKKKLHLSH